MKQVPVKEAVGMVLCHDMTQIIPGKFKGTAFKKGHVITEEDIPRLLDIGKEHIFVWDLQEGYTHEDDAAIRIATAAAKNGVELTAPHEGKVEMKSASDGVIRIKKEAVDAINAIDEMCLATIHGNRTIKKGDKIAGTRVIPLVVKTEYLEAVEQICKKYEPVIEVVPFTHKRVGVVTTGSEVFSGRIQDKFGPVLKKKFAGLDAEVTEQIFAPDDVNEIVRAIHKHLADKVDLIAVTGGMSVDPDDLTPTAIRQAGGELVSYGAPVLPGAMFLLSYIDGVPVVGLPGCVMYHKTSIFDLVVPRILAGENMTKQDIKAFGYGGLCLNCEECKYPNCSFGV